MDYALIADVHGNVEALDAVLTAITRAAPSARLVCAGDLVGYGPDPEACIDRLRGHDAVCVIGNHDQMVLGRRGFERANHAGIRAARWTRDRLSTDALDYLATLPATADLPGGLFVCHGTPWDADLYIDGAAMAGKALAALEEMAPTARVLVCGHTHHAAIHLPDEGFRRPPPPRAALPGEATAIVNPGAVGQSRDGQPLARYALLDTTAGTVRFGACAYDVPTTLRKLRRVGLVPRVDAPPPHGWRGRLGRYRTRWARWRTRPPPPFSRSGRRSC